MKAIEQLMRNFSAWKKFQVGETFVAFPIEDGMRIVAVQTMEEKYLPFPGALLTE